MLSPTAAMGVASVTAALTNYARVYSSSSDDRYVQVLSGGGVRGDVIEDYRADVIEGYLFRNNATSAYTTDTTTDNGIGSDVTDCDYCCYENECGDELMNVFMYYLWTFVTPCLFAVILLVGATGNFLVIYVILSRPDMRSITNILLVSLALADVAFLFICIPFNAYKVLVLISYL